MNLQGIESFPRGRDGNTPKQATQRRECSDMKTIIVGYDGSPAARLALERAARLAQAFGSTVVVATIKKLPPPDTAIAAGGYGAMPVEADQMREKKVRSAYSQTREATSTATRSPLRPRQRPGGPSKKSLMSPRSTTPT
jgi:hypothetical protein